jgi:hypothetical protein
MKKSTRWMAVCVLYGLFVVAGIVIAMRFLFEYEPYGLTSDDSARDESAGIPDSCRASGPGSKTPWYRITMGLHGAGIGRFDETASIFRDLQVDCDDVSHLGSYKLTHKNRWKFQPDRHIFFDYHLRPGDSTGHNDADPAGSIRVWVIKDQPESTGPGSPSLLFRKMDVLHIPYTDHNGIRKFERDSIAQAQWYGNGWLTEIRVQWNACGGDSAKAGALRDKMCERILAYYDSLR